MNIKGFLKDAHQLAIHEGLDKHVYQVIAGAALVMGLSSGLVTHFAFDKKNERATTQFNEKINNIGITVSEAGWNFTKVPTDKPVSADDINALTKSAQTRQYVQNVINNHQTNITVHPETAEAVAAELNSQKQSPSSSAGSTGLLLGAGAALSLLFTSLIGKNNEGAHVMITPLFIPEALRQRANDAVAPELKA